MKKYITLFLSVALFASCSDWLDVTPKDKILEKDLFATEYGVYNATNGLYREMVAENLYGGHLSQTTIEMMGHVYTYPLNEPAGSETSSVLPFWALANFKYDKDKNVKDRFSNIWKTGYATLLHINTYIKNLSESSVVMAERDRDILLGEAYGMRAYIHFDLLRLFGPMWKNKDNSKILPYNNKPEVTITHTGYEEAEYKTADEFMALLLEDITTAEDLLEDDPIISDDKSITNKVSDESYFDNRNRRMNYYAVKGLEARIQQYRGEYALAAQAAKVITDQVGEPGSSNRFQWAVIGEVVDQKNYIFFSEVIFGINNMDMILQADTWYGATEMGRAYAVDSKNLIANILHGGSTLTGMIDIRSKQWELNDVTSFSGAAYSMDGSYRSKKYKKASYNEDDIPAIRDLQPLMRISEMYYIQAEAALKDGNKAGATSLLNTVLQHRGLTEQYFMTPEKTDSEFQDHIEKEYYREFYGEGQIFFFHKRRGSTKMFKGYGEGYDNIPFPSVDYVVPIPEDEENI